MLWSLFAVFYCTVAFFGIVMTCGESLQSSDRRSPLLTAFGIVACVAWPLVLLVMTVSARRAAV